MVELVTGYFLNCHSARFVRIEELRRANLVGNDVACLVNCNDLGNVINNFAVYMALQGRSLSFSI